MTSPHLMGKVRVFYNLKPTITSKVISIVLECSIIRRTDMHVDFIPMLGKEWEYKLYGLPPIGCDEFILRRWLIPKNVNYTGKAIYIDVNSLVLSDIWDLWTKPQQTGLQNNAVIWCTYKNDIPQTDLMVIDCNRAEDRWGFNANIADYLSHNHNAFDDFQKCTWLTKTPVRIDDTWFDSNEKYSPSTKIINYSNCPWLDTNINSVSIWQKELSIAMHTGLLPREMLKEAIDEGGIHQDYMRFVLDKYGKKVKKRVVL